MDPHLGNVYTDLSPMHVDDALYTALLASTSAIPVYPVTTPTHSLPGHLVPGVSFDAYCRSLQVEAFGVYDEACAAENTCDFNSSCQSFHPDWTTTTERTWDVISDEVVGRGFPPMGSIFNLDSVGEGTTTPFSDMQDLRPRSGDAFDSDSWVVPAFPEGSPDLCDDVIQAFVAERMPLGALSQLRLDFDGQGVSRSVFDEPSGATLVCQWCDSGSPCSMSYSPGNNLKHSVSQHFTKVHSLSAGGKLAQRCRWLGCTKELKQESIIRHILAVHLRVKSTCEGCGTFFARPDSLQRHMKKSCGAVKEER